MRTIAQAHVTRAQVNDIFTCVGLKTLQTAAEGSKQHQHEKTEAANATVTQWTLQV